MPAHYVAPDNDTVNSKLIDQWRNNASRDPIDDAQPSSLLIVEDFDGIRAYLSKYFEREGYEVFSASSIRAALSLVHAITPDVIIVDFDLGSENPLELIAKAKTMVPDTPIVLIGGHDTELNRLKVESAGVRYFIPKAYDIKLIESMVQDLTRSRVVNPRDDEPTYE